MLSSRPATTRASGLTQVGVLPPVASPELSPSASGCFNGGTADRNCPQCSQPISPDDTLVFGHGRLGHFDCRRPRVLNAEVLRARGVMWT